MTNLKELSVVLQRLSFNKNLKLRTLRVHLKRYKLDNFFIYNKRQIRVVLTRLQSTNNIQQIPTLRQLCVLLTPMNVTIRQPPTLNNTITNIENVEPVVRNVGRPSQYIYPPGGILLPFTKKRLYGTGPNAVIGESLNERQRRVNREVKCRNNEARAAMRLNQQPLAYRGSTNIERHNLGIMNLRCQYCRALHFSFEKLSGNDDFSNCCERGKVSLTNIQVHPYIIDLCCNENNRYFQKYH